MTTEKTNEVPASSGGCSLEPLDRRASKINRLTEVKLVAEPPNGLTRYARTKEREAELLEDWVKELESFMRDHGSQDPVQLYVERVRQDVCSECESPWETCEDEGKTICASCGVEVAASPIDKLSD